MNTLSLTTSLTGIIFLIMGFIMLRFPPKKINRVYGYRTARSMKNQPQWDFAQVYSAKEMMKLGALLALCSVPFLFIRLNETAADLLTIILLIAVIATLSIRVERAIRIRFPDSLAD